MSAPGVYLISKLCGTAFIEGRLLKGRDAYFKIWGIILLKFQKFVFFLFPNNDKLPPSWCIVLEILELLVTFIFFIVFVLVPYAF